MHPVRRTLLASALLIVLSLSGAPDAAVAQRPQKPVLHGKHGDILVGNGDQALLLLHAHNLPLQLEPALGNLPRLAGSRRQAKRQQDDQWNPESALHAQLGRSHI